MRGKPAGGKDSGCELCSHERRMVINAVADSPKGKLDRDIEAGGCSKGVLEQRS